MFAWWLTKRLETEWKQQMPLCATLILFLETWKKSPASKCLSNRCCCSRSKAKVWYYSALMCVCSVCVHVLGGSALCWLWSLLRSFCVCVLQAQPNTHSQHKHAFLGVFVEGATIGREEDKLKVKLHVWAQTTVAHCVNPLCAVCVRRLSKNRFDLDLVSRGGTRLQRWRQSPSRAHGDGFICWISLFRLTNSHRWKQKGTSQRDE